MQLKMKGGAPMKTSPPPPHAHPCGLFLTLQVTISRCLVPVNPPPPEGPAPTHALGSSKTSVSLTST